MSVLDLMPPMVKRIRAYFAPVMRVNEQPTLFDPAQQGAFPLDSPPAPWVDLGWISGFSRKSGTVISGLRTGAPAATQLQSRTEIGAALAFKFESWGKLQLSLSAGAQQMNLLACNATANLNGSGGLALPAVPLLAGTSATTLNVGTDASAMFSPGSLVAVDVDLVSGTTGYIGSGVSGAYLKSSPADVDFVRRVTLNVSRVATVANGVLTLETPLLAGVPSAAMKASLVKGFCDREGSTFFQEWSALFVAEGQQGERVLWHYPRLQTSQGIAEDATRGTGSFDALRLSANFQALPVVDPADGERVVCFRSFLTA